MLSNTLKYDLYRSPARSREALTPKREGGAKLHQMGFDAESTVHRLESLQKELCKEFKQLVNKRKKATLRSLRGVDLVLPEKCRYVMYELWTHWEAVVKSPYATRDCLQNQLGSTLVVLCECRETWHSLFEYGKHKQATSANIVKELKFLQSTIKHLEEMVDSFLYSYGNKVATTAGGTLKMGPKNLQASFDESSNGGNNSSSSKSKSSVFATLDKKFNNRKALPGGKGKKNTHLTLSGSIFRTLKRNQLTLESIAPPTLDENKSENTEETDDDDSVASSKKAIVKREEDTPTYIRPLYSAPLVLLSQLLRPFQDYEKNQLYLLCPELRTIQKEVDMFAKQKYDGVVLSFYVADTVGKAAMTILKNTDTRRKFWSILRTVSQCARANSWSALQMTHGLDLSSSRTPWKQDLDALLG